MQFQIIVIYLFFITPWDKEVGSEPEGNQHFLAYSSHSISRRLDVSSPGRDDNVVFIKECNCASPSTRNWYSSYSHIGDTEKKHRVGKLHRVGLHSMTEQIGLLYLMLFKERQLEIKQTTASSYLLYLFTLDNSASS